MMHARKKHIRARLRRTGMTVVELVVYVGLMSVFLAFIVTALSQIQKTYREARTEHNVISNGRSALDAIVQAIASAQEVYAPSSNFGQSNGQLSLVTVVGATPEHTTAYVDFWVDNGQIWTRREGSLAVAMTSPEVRVNEFRFDHIRQGLDREAIRITLQMVGTISENIIASTTLHTTTALRGSY